MGFRTGLVIGALIAGDKQQTATVVQPDDNGAIGFDGAIFLMLPVGAAVFMALIIRRVMRR